MEILLKSDPVLARAHDEYVHFTEDKQLHMAYEAREKYRRDQLFMLSSARQEGRAEGREKGIYEIATKMKRSGMAFELIRQFTSLSLEEIAEI